MRSWSVIHFDLKGPVAWQRVSQERIIEQIKAGVLSWVDLAKPVGMNHLSWKRIYEIEEFRALQPKVPMDLIEKLSKSAPDPERQQFVTDKQADSALPSGILAAREEATLRVKRKEMVFDFSESLNQKVRKTEWFIRVTGAVFGPLEAEEMKSVLQANKLKGPVSLWNTSLKDWTPVSRFPSLAGFLPQPDAFAESVVPRLLSDRRAAFRQAIVATVLFSHNLREIGLCSNISDEGLQVSLNGELGMKAGDEIILTIAPLGVAGMPAFHVNAILAWENPQISRAGFQFHKVSPPDRETLMKFLGLIHQRKSSSSTQLVPEP